jgi:hypothetical protein
MIKNLIDNDGYNDLYFILVVSIWFFILLMDWYGFYESMMKCYLK